MTTITIEMDETGAGTMSIDGAEPAPFQSAEEVCQVIEAMAGQPDADEAAAFGEASAEAEAAQPVPQRPQRPQMGARGM